MTSSNATLLEADGAVRALLDEVYAAWADGDADAFVAPYAETATAIMPGRHLAGREAIRDAMASGFAGDLRGSTAVH
jgi:uncharacterized protein (TIGR02246 family)